MSLPTLAELLAQVQLLTGQARALDSALGRFHDTKAERGPLDEHLEDTYAGVLDAYHLVNQAKGALVVAQGDLRAAQRAETLAAEVRALGWVWGRRDEDKGWRAFRPGRAGTTERAMVQVFGHTREQLLAAIAAADGGASAAGVGHA